MFLARPQKLPKDKRGRGLAGAESTASLLDEQAKKQPAAGRRQMPGVENPRFSCCHCVGVPATELRAASGSPTEASLLPRRSEEEIVNEIKTPEGAKCGWYLRRYWRLRSGPRKGG